MSQIRLILRWLARLAVRSLTNFRAIWRVLKLVFQLRRILKIAGGIIFLRDLIENLIKLDDLLHELLIKLINPCQKQLEENANAGHPKGKAEGSLTGTAG